MEKNTRILAIETSGSTCGAALIDNSGLLGEYNLYGSNLHDRLLSENIRRLLGDLSFDVKDIDAVAVSAGPGSFTGLRIGAAVAKGLCFGDNPPLIAVPTLSALALAASQSYGKFEFYKILPVIPAYKDIIYYQEFDKAAKPKSEIQTGTISEFAVDSGNTLLCGPGAGLVSDDSSVEVLNTLSPAYIATLGMQMFREGKLTSTTDFTPHYVQEFEPKTNRKKLNI